MRNSFVSPSQQSVRTSQEKAAFSNIPQTTYGELDAFREVQEQFPYFFAHNEQYPLADTISISDNPDISTITSQYSVESGQVTIEQYYYLSDKPNLSASFDIESDQKIDIVLEGGLQITGSADGEYFYATGFIENTQISFIGSAISFEAFVEFIKTTSVLS